jgi:hypothetical protein
MQDTAAASPKTEATPAPAATASEAPASLRPTPPSPTPARETSAADERSEPRADATSANSAATEQAEAIAPAGEEAAARSVASFPGGGAIVVRVSPISGFQGLMRVQDAIANLAEVREAAVEAYARGEAQLRVALTDELAPERLTKALADGLGQDARVESASVDERTMRVTLA